MIECGIEIAAAQVIGMFQHHVAAPTDFMAFINSCRRIKFDAVSPLALRSHATRNSPHLRIILAYVCAYQTDLEIEPGLELFVARQDVRFK